MNDSEQAFEDLVDALATRGFAAEIERVDETQPFAELAIVVHVDDQGRTYVARAVFLNDISEAAAGSDAAGDTIYLQLVCVLPFELSGPERLADVGSLLFILNRLMPLPQFGLSEEEGLVFLRAVITAEARALPPALVGEAVDMMQVFLEAFGAPIERLATGQASLDEVARGLGAAGFVAPPLFEAPDLDA